MNFPARFPQSLCDYFRQSYPSLVEVETLLSGMSGSYVYRITFEDRVVIVKSSLRPLEKNFYQNFAPTLREQGVAIPAAYWLGEEGGQAWLVLENIPQPWPREQWSANRAVLEIIGRLHSAQLPPGPDFSNLFQPRWIDEMTASALQLLGEEGERIAPLLKKWQAGCQHIFNPLCPISADTNPGNWGLRDDGSRVLFDWERFTFGSPAIDLAVLVPGLPAKADFRRIAETYRELNPENLTKILGEKQSFEDFIEDLKVAKIWTVVEFLSEYATGTSGIPEDFIKSLCERIPGWLESLA